MKQVRETSDASAYVILNKKGEHVATVQFRFGSGGAVQCDVWSRKPGEKYLSLTHQKKASGYGYDKRAAALAGAMIEGYAMANHCGQCEPEGEKKRAAIMRAYIKAAAAHGVLSPEVKQIEKRAAAHGFRFANYCRCADMPSEPGDKPGEVLHGYRYTSLHVASGLERLEMLGFRVICAL